MPEETDHENGGVPFAATRVCEYITPTVPPGSDVVVIDNAGWMVIDSAFVFDKGGSLESRTTTEKLKVPATEGVPLIVFPANDKPDGSDPVETDQRYGVTPPVAARLCEYEFPTTPADSAVVVITSGSGSILIERS